MRTNSSSCVFLLVKEVFSMRYPLQLEGGLLSESTRVSMIHLWFQCAHFEALQMHAIGKGLSV